MWLDELGLLGLFLRRLHGVSDTDRSDQVKHLKWDDYVDAGVVDVDDDVNVDDDELESSVGEEAQDVVTYAGKNL